jgi:hypothetical protein
MEQPERHPKRRTEQFYTHDWRPQLLDVFDSEDSESSDKEENEDTAHPGTVIVWVAAVLLAGCVIGATVLFVSLWTR